MESQYFLSLSGPDWSIFWQTHPFFLISAVSTSIFDYTSAIISYCLVGVAIFSGKYDSLSPAAVSAVISKVHVRVHTCVAYDSASCTWCECLCVCCVCLCCIHVFMHTYLFPATNDSFCCSLQNAFISMYLLNNFSTVVDTAVKFSDVAGYTHRYIHVPSICVDIYLHIYWASRSEPT